MVISDSNFIMCNNLSDSPRFTSSMEIDSGYSGKAPQSEILTQHDSKIIIISFEPISENNVMIVARTSYWPKKLEPLKLATVFLPFPLLCHVKVIQRT
jgi:hypothetical protein